MHKIIVNREYLENRIKERLIKSQTKPDKALTPNIIMLRIDDVADLIGGTLSIGSVSHCAVFIRNICIDYLHDHPGRQGESGIVLRFNGTITFEVNGSKNPNKFLDQYGDDFCLYFPTKKPMNLSNTDNAMMGSRVEENECTIWVK